jgi:hypothetical protein
MDAKIGHHVSDYDSYSNASYGILFQQLRIVKNHVLEWQQMDTGAGVGNTGVHSISCFRSVPKEESFMYSHGNWLFLTITAQCTNGCYYRDNQSDLQGAISKDIN